MNKRRLPNWFAIAAFLLGNGFVFVNPPLKAPDESAHFARAYQVSRLQLLPLQRNGILGGYIPVGIETLGKRFEKVSFDGVSVAEIIAARRIPFDPSDVRFSYFPNIAEYPWLPFIPQAVGITLARICFTSALATMYCGREANLIGFIVLTYAALAMMPDPRCRLTLALIALLPMSLYQAGSLSADGVTIAMSFFVVTIVWRLTFLEAPVSKFDLSAMFISTICLSLTKLSYSPISLLVLMIPPKRLGGFRRYAAIAATLLLSNCLAIVLWMSQFHGLPKVDLNPAVDPPQQERYLLHHPGKIAPLLISTTTTYGKEIATGVIGTFGWNEIMMPPILVAIYYALLLTSVGANGPPCYWRGAILATSTAIFNIGAMLTAFFIQCRPVGETAIAGLQGRYFIPLLPLMIFFSGGKNITGAKFERALLIVAVLITAFSVLFLAQELFPGCPFSRFYYRWSD
jgi:uncharacterized membrane protein